MGVPGKVAEEFCMGGTPKRPGTTIAIVVLCTLLTPALHAQEVPPPPPPPPPPPAQVLPSITVPAPAPYAGVAPIPLGGPARANVNPAPSINPFAAVLPPPAGAAVLDTPPLLFDFWAIGQHPFTGSPSNLTMSQMSIAYDFRYPIGPMTFGARPQFEVMFLNGPTPPGPNLPPQAYGLAVALEAEYRFSQQFSVRAMITPGLYTDFNNVNGHAFRFPAQVIGAYAINPRLVFVGGVIYTAQPSWSILPVVGAIWTTADEWRLELTFPQARIIRHLDAGLDVYGRFGLQGETYAVRQLGQNDLMQYRDVRLGLGAEWNTPMRLQIFVEAGIALFRRLEFENQSNSNIDSGLYLRVGGQF
jgi:hypothetical protein